ncbi:MAG: DeoR/GlpR family DNA-binding transcription regulator [Solirubrobacteraceae bacterium]|jgi:DeoR/GlpR family transcriptional regulator of sugar metabolism
MTQPTIEQGTPQSIPEAAELGAIPEDRRRSIADLLLATGAVTVSQVETRFGVSAMTARRDLGELERRGLARRTHGGAVLPNAAGHEDSFDRRLNVATAPKRMLARAAVELLNPHDTVFLDSSTTTYFVAREIIASGVAATVLTNSLPIMTLLASDAGPNIELIGVGGTLRTLTRSFVGAGATRTVNEHYADRLFLSVKGVVDGDTLTDADSLEADVKRSMIAHARESVLLIDGSKLTERGLIAIAPLSQIAIALATDISADQAAALGRAGTTVRVIRPEAAGQTQAPAGPSQFGS